MAIDHIHERLYRVLENEITRTLVLLAIAYGLVLASLVSFVLIGPRGPSSRLEFALLAAAIGLLVYVVVQSSTF